MSGKRSRDKGKSGEREFARYLTAEGFDARRGVQYQGGKDSPDVVCECLPGVHFEVKRRERLSLYDALDQAAREGGSRLPVVAHRRNRHRWVAIVDMEALLGLLRESGHARGPTVRVCEINEAVEC